MMHGTMNVKCFFIYYRSFGTTYGSNLQGSRIQKKPVIPIGRLYRDRCSWRKVSVVWCQPIRLMQVVWGEGSVVVRAAGERDFEC